MDFAAGVRLVAVDVILRQAVEFGGIGLDDFFVVGNIAIEHGLLFAGLIVQFLEAGAGGVIFVDAGEAEFEQLTLHVILRGGVGVRKIEPGERVVNIVIEGDCGLRGAGLGKHRRRVVTES